jgi:NAD(P)H-dependent flavin oxidoreductase YrpB (nitropropane dioxygenase family)
MDFSMIKGLQLPKLDLRNIEWPRFDFSGIQWPKMPKLRIGDAVARLPIIQGGMGVGISLSGLASAVANAGGIGVIAANKEIRKAQKLTSGLLGVNIMVAVDDYPDLVRVAIEEKIDMVFLGAGLPIKGIPVEDLRAAGVKVVPIVSSARAAALIFKSWSKKYRDIPDAVVVEGPKAGGHLGFKAEQIDDPDFALEKILPDVVAEIKAFEGKYHRTIPVIAAGGVFTGADIYKVFKLGASGVQMGTRFVATHECDANIRFKESYVSCREDDIEIIKSPVGLPGRAIRNSFLKNVAAGKKMGFKCAWRCLKSCDLKNARYCISLALDNARQGILDKGFAFAGSNAFRVDKIVSVNELLQELINQYQLAEEKGASKLKDEYDKALEKLVSLKEEYVIAAKNGLNSLKDDYERGIEKGAELFREEYLKTMDKIDLLKADYQNAVDKANRLKAELVELFEQYSLFDKLQIEGTCQEPCR